MNSRWITLSHAPLSLLIIGITLFYAQMTLGWWQPGQSSFVLGAFCVALLLGNMFFLAKGFARVLKMTLAEIPSHLSIWAAVLLAALSLFFLVGFVSALKPAHLFHEADFFHYHLLLTKQYWIAKSWAPVEWQHYEFIYIVIQDALSFMWVGLPWLNKLPQFMFGLSLVLKIWIFISVVCSGPGPSTKKPLWTGLLAAVLFLSFRGVAIEWGSAMLDLVALDLLMGVLLIAAQLLRSNSTRSQKTWLSLLLGVNLAFLLGFKSFYFAFCIVFFGSLILSLRVFFKQDVFAILKKLSIPAIILPTLFIVLPTTVRTFYYTGDPVHPLLPKLTEKLCNPSRLHEVDCKHVVQAAQTHQREGLTQYGYGKGPVSFLRSLAELGFSKRVGLNGSNSYDYPLGLMWYFAILFLIWSYFALQSREHKKIVGAVLTSSFLIYGMWFMGSQQGRWLYPILLLFSLSIAWTLTSAQKLNKLTVIATLLLACFLLTHSFRILWAQKHTLPYFGFSTLKHAALPNLADDYRHACPTDGSRLLLDTDLNRGYLNCLVRK